jgi:heterodisulfide reductase subunit C2
MEKTQAKTFREEVWSIPGGEAIKLCIQCGTCAGSCLNANQMEYSPRKVIAMVRADMKEEVLRSNSMWYCVSCYLCTARCPRDIHITDMMYVLKGLAIDEGYAKKRGLTSNMAKSMVESINKYGRVFEAEMVIRYFLRTRPLKLVGMGPFGLKMWAKGKMPLRPHKIKGKEQIRKMLVAAEALEGKQ